VGEVRRIDKLGRVVIPLEVRRALGIDKGDLLEIYVERGDVVLQKARPACIFCGGGEEIVEFRGRNVCRRCLDLLRQQAV